MVAAKHFVDLLCNEGVIHDVFSVKCSLMGSLAATGYGHQTPNAIIAGLQGYIPEDYVKKDAKVVWSDIEKEPQKLSLNGKKEVIFKVDDLKMMPDVKNPIHPNALQLTAYNSIEQVIFRKEYLSVGGGAVKVRDDDEVYNDINDKNVADISSDKNSDDISNYQTMSQLVALCMKHQTTISEVARRQEEVHYGDSFDEEKLNNTLDKTWDIMNQSIADGLDNYEQDLPGGLLKRRAANIYRKALNLKAQGVDVQQELVSAYAIAVSEQNGSGERIVTAPTAGACGVIPAVLRYFLEESKNSGWLRPVREKILIRQFLLTACVVGSIIKSNGSISGAECGCQAEIGSACAMAAAGLTAIKGGTPSQIENAAEIALEYHFGLTCDPVKGLVLIPCIERNAMAANTAFTASSLALVGDGEHVVSLDTAIETMRQTGIDMNEAYKETSKAGLATFVNC